MSYIVTARKWRPIVYEDVVGQKHITTTLRNAIATNRLSHAFIYRRLSSRAAPRLAKAGITHTSNVFGLLQNARVSEAYILRLLPLLPPGDSELYSHPSLDEFRHEYDALVSRPVKDLLSQSGIKLIRYQDI